jgi:hypothetical protein
MKMAASRKKKIANDEVRAEYDFRAPGAHAVRGKYAEAYRERLRVVRIDKDVAEAFSDEKAVNAALRAYLKQRKPRVRAARAHTSP